MPQSDVDTAIVGGPKPPPAPTKSLGKSSRLLKLLSEKLSGNQAAAIANKPAAIAKVEALKSAQAIRLAAEAAAGGGGGAAPPPPSPPPPPPDLAPRPNVEPIVAPANPVSPAEELLRSRLAGEVFPALSKIDYRMDVNTAALTSKLVPVVMLVSRVTMVQTGDPVKPERPWTQADILNAASAIAHAVQGYTERERRDRVKNIFEVSLFKGFRNVIKGTRAQTSIGPKAGKLDTNFSGTMGGFGKPASAKRPRFEKGSPEAKAFMAELRAKRHKK